MVDLSAVATIAGTRPLCYLVTVAANGHPHASAVVPMVEPSQAVLIVEPGDRSVANARGHAAVSLLWPPQDPDGHTLFVDGEAEVDHGRVVIRPSRAVLHRPGPAPMMPQSPQDCTGDCVELSAPDPTGASR